jgi:tetratricopeptide (TPR) repeat protein
MSGAMYRASRISLLVALLVGAIGVAQANFATAAEGPHDQICDVVADFALGSEDYAQAIKLHQAVVAAHPENALAHYHLGFAFGMADRRDQELAEYSKAAKLGLRQWDLYLNLGRVYLESHDFLAATDALTTAVKLGPRHPEAHFNLGLALEGQQMFAQAEQEMRIALSLGGDRAEVSNMLAVICAEEGKQAEARRIWTELAGSQPGSAVARTNLAILDSREGSGPQAPPVMPTSAVYSQSLP